ncbi:MAG: TonB-dependent receptor [Silvibacterium sp.]|nr:TonB-dependent receptor [Silvibacterium sp.]
MLSTLLVAGFANLAAGQGITTGSITGTVIDASGAVIRGGTVMAKNLGTDAQTVQHTRDDGSFSLVYLPTGNYSLTIEATGFEKLDIQQVTVAVGETNIGPQRLKIGSSTVVEVEGNATPLIETTQAQVSNALDSQQLQNLPFGGGFDTAALLSPGEVITHDNSFSNNNGAYGGFSSQGQRGRSNNFEIDGQSNNDNSVAGPQVFFSNQDAVDSIQIITNNFSAQYGRNAGSVVNYITRSGSNKFHGTAFYWYEGNWGESFAQGQKSPFQGFCPPGVKPSDTNPCTVPILPRFVQNIFGGSLGGPILHDKLFGFGSAYFDRNHAGGGTTLNLTSITPTPDGLTALSSTFPNAPGVAALVNNGPYSVKTGNPQPAGQVYTIPVTYNGVTANIPFAGITRSVPSYSNDEEVLGRVDWQPNTNNHFFARYFYQDDPSYNPSGISVATIAAGAWYNVPDTAHSIGADWEHTFSPGWVNQVRYSYQQTKLFFQGGGQAKCVVTSPDQCTANVSFGSSKLTDVSGNTYGVLGFGYATNLPQGRFVKVTQVQDNATWTTGRQTILFGGEWDYQNSPNPFLPFYEGAFAFSGATSASNPVMTNFLSGTSRSLTLANGNFSIHFTEPDYALYFQDDWKVRPDLTLNMGLRWEYFTQAVNILHNETVTRETNPATAFWDTSLPLSVRTFPYTDPAYKNFQPRFGFAYNPERFSNKLVVRGGFAINFDPAFYNMFLNSATAAPVVNNGTIRGCGVTKQCMPSSGVLAAQVRAQSLPYIPTGPGVNPGSRNTTYNSHNFHNPYTESYYLGVETAIGNRVSLDMKYVGNHQVGNFQSIDGNPYLLPIQQQFPNYAPIALCTDTTAVGYGRPDCTHANVRTRTNGAFANYNALQTQVKTREFHGLTSLFNWTYSKTIDNTSEVYSTFAGGNSITFAQNPLNPDAPERGLSAVSMTHVVSAGFTYLLPIHRTQNGLVGRLLGGWQLNGIYTFNTAQPGTPYQYGFFGDGAGYQSYTSDVPFMNWQLSGYDVARPVLSNPKAPLNQVGVYDPDGSVCGVGQGYFNWADCSPSSPTAVHWLRNTQALANLMGGNNPYIGSGRSLARSQSWNNLDASLYKTTKLTEALSMQLQLVAYNALNRQYLGMPDLGIDDVSTTPSSNTFEDLRWNFGSNRNVQIGVKFIF